MGVMKLFDGQSVAAGGTEVTEWVDLEGKKDIAVWVDLGTGSTDVTVEAYTSPYGAWEMNESSITGKYVSSSLASSVGDADLHEYDTTGTVPESGGSMAVALTENGGSISASADVWLTWRDLWP